MPTCSSKKELKSSLPRIAPNWASGLIAQSGAIAFKKSHTIKLAQKIVGRTYEPPLRSLSIAALTFPPVCSSAAAASSVFVKPIPAICSSCGA